MDASLTFAKITTPGPGSAVRRDQLFASLDHAGENKLVWISGPAGCGKTTLAADYVHRNKLNCLWYQVDCTDNDPATLFHFLRIAAQTKRRRSRRPLPPEFAPEFIPGLQAFSRRFFRDLFACLSLPSTIVFDNVQEVTLDSAFFDVLREGLFELPSGCRVIFISRSDPPPNFSGYRAKREMTLIDWKDLRLSETEIAQLVVLLEKKTLSPEQIKQILSVSDGWVAGVVLIAAMLEQLELSSLTPNDEPVQNMFDYFATEVFHHVDDSEQHFLFRSAFLPEMTVPLAEEITNNPEAERILTRLSRENFFTNRKSGRQTSYQYHPLFRAFLQNHAKATLSADAIRNLQKTAAALLETDGRIDSASELYIEMQDWANLSRLVAEWAPKLMANARVQTIAGWLGALPKALKETSPQLLYWDGVTHIGIGLDQPLSRLERSLVLFRERNDTRGQYLALAAMVDAVTAAWVDFRPFDRCIEEFDALQRRDPEIPDKHIEARVLTNIVVAKAHRRISDPNLSVEVNRLIELIKEPLDLASRVSAGGSLIACLCVWSEYTKAGIILESLQPTNKRDCPPQVWIMFHIWKMLFCWLTGNFDECRKAEQEALGAINESGAHTMQILVVNQALSCALSEGDCDRAKTILSQISVMLDNDGPTPQWQQSFPLRWMYHFYFAWTNLLEGKSLQAAEHGAWSLDYSDRMGDLFVMLSHLVIANATIEKGDVERAHSHLEAIDRIDPHQLIVPIYTAKLFAEADLARRTQNSDRLHAALGQGFAMARDHDLKNTDFWLADQMAELAVSALETGIEIEYVRMLIRERDLRPRKAPRHLEAWPWPLAVRTLGDFALFRDGERVSFRGKAQQKPLDLLKALIAFGGSGVSIVRLQDALWPDSEGDAAERAFDITLHRLRKLLRIDGALERSENRITVSPHVFWLDTWALDDLIEKATIAMGGVSSPRGEVDIEEIEDKILELSQGAFLAHISDEPWAIATRNEISTKLAKFHFDLGRYWQRTDKPEKAILCFQRGLDQEAKSKPLRSQLTDAIDDLNRKNKHTSS